MEGFRVFKIIFNNNNVLYLYPGYAAVHKKTLDMGKFRTIFAVDVALQHSG